MGGGVISNRAQQDNRTYLSIYDIDLMLEISEVTESANQIPFEITVNEKRIYFQYKCNIGTFGFSFCIKLNFINF